MKGTARAVDHRYVDMLVDATVSCLRMGRGKELRNWLGWYGALTGAAGMWGLHEALMFLKTQRGVATGSVMTALRMFLDNLYASDYAESRIRAWRRCSVTSRLDMVFQAVPTESFEPKGDCA